MTLIQELEAMAGELATRHPQFPRVTIERLVRRTGDRLKGRVPAESLVAAVRREASEQLDYADDPPAEATAS